MSKVFTLPKDSAIRRLWIQLFLLSLASVGAGIAIIAKQIPVGIVAVTVGALAVKNIRCWILVFAANAKSDTIEVRH